METEFFDYKVGALVEYVGINGKQEDYHKQRGLGIIVGWERELQRWKVHWPGSNIIPGGWNTFEWTDNLRTIG